MAGELWLQVRELAEGLDPTPYWDAAEDWSRINAVWTFLDEELGRSFTALRDSGLRADVGDALEQASRRTVEATSGLAAATASPGQELHNLVRHIDWLKDAVAEQDSFLTGFPTHLSGDPDLRLLQEVQLARFDQVGRELVAGFVAAVGAATAALTGMVSSGVFPPQGLPQGDQDR